MQTHKNIRPASKLEELYEFCTNWSYKNSLQHKICMNVTLYNFIEIKYDYIQDQ